MPLRPMLREARIRDRRMRRHARNQTTLPPALWPDTLPAAVDNPMQESAGRLREALEALQALEGLEVVELDDDALFCKLFGPR